MFSGLGIGTTPSALVSHGIDTTVVEIDPVVYEFAQKYFELRENNPAVVEDAVKYTARAANETKEVYDYIVHDVFTGGAEPVDLFTLEFFQNLYTLLKPDGVVAIVRTSFQLLILSACPGLLMWRIELRGRPDAAGPQDDCPDHFADLSDLSSLPRESSGSRGRH